MNDKALIIFARKPELGKVKTRLAATIGDEKALHIYTMLLQHTKNVVQAVDCDTYIFLTEQTNDNFWDGFFIDIQQGETLGNKMQHAFQQLFSKGYKNIVIVGSDCPTLTSKIITDAFNALTEHQVVIGPAEDGGYYLLGMQQLQTAFFENKNWSTNSVFNHTMENINDKKLSFFILPTLNDVDELKDVPDNWL